MPEELSENKKRLAEITAGIEQGIRDLWQSDRYKQYLQVMGRFHHYSVNNTMLIYMQKPNASLVAGYRKWEKNFGRHVKRGEKGIKIMAPTPFKKKVEEQKLDPDTKAPMLDGDGKAIMEEKEITVPAYRVVSVFDVSQTDGKPLPQLAATLRGDVRYYGVFMEALKRTSPVPMSFDALTPGMDGVFNLDRQEITLREGMSEVQTFCAAIHEITHATLHNYEKERMAAQEESKDPPKPKTRQTEEIEAESVAYAVSQYYGIDTSPNSFGYLASWSQGKDLTELRDSLETVNMTAGKLIRDIDMHFMDVCKERGIDLSPDMQDGLYLINDSMYLHIQASENGYDYTLYNKKDMKLIDGGQLDRQAVDRANSADPLAEVRNEVYKMLGLVDNIQVEPVSLDMVEQLQAAQFPPAEQPTPTAAPVEQPEAPAQHLDEYPMPDKSLSMDDLKAAGYADMDLVPLPPEMALDYMNKGMTVYSVVDGGAELCLDTGDIINAPDDVLFTVARDEWEDSKDFEAQVKDRMDHQPEREAAFLAHPGDSFAIYQLKDDDSLRDHFYTPLEDLQKAGLSVDRANYDLVYTGELPRVGTIFSSLNTLWEQFNMEKPADFLHPSMSVSDIVAISQGGEVSCHYCDRVGFKELNGFLDNNPLKNAEMAVEDDQNMIDGIINNGAKDPPTVADLEAQVKAGQSISLMDLAAAVHREQPKPSAKRTSVLEKLKAAKPYSTQTQHNTAPKKSAEMEM